MQSSQLNSTARSLREFKRVAEEALQAKFEVPLSMLPKEEQLDWKKRARELHPSTLPFCGLRAWYERTNLLRTDPLVERSFQKDYILQNGHLMHQLLQQWLGRQMTIYGNWRCPKCNTLREFKPRPRKACSCGADQWQYEELGGRWGKNTVWHTDTLWRDSAKRFWAVDYKSTASTRIKAHQQSGDVFPYPRNRLQLETYILLEEQQYEIDIEGWILFYLSRDYPYYQMVVVGEKFDEDRRKAVAEHLRKSDRLLSVVLQPPSIETANKTEKHKLCPSFKFYKDKVHDEYSPCPLAEDKVCFKQVALDKRIQQALKDLAKRKR